MIYQISCDQPLKHIIDITLTIDHIEEDQVLVNLPSWRPGRYELANFAKNIYKVKAKDKTGKNLIVEKARKDQWKILCEGTDTIEINYQYYANQPDAGGSVADETQLYINFVNCLLYWEDRINEPCKVQLNLPDDFKLASGLPQSGKNLYPHSYYHLVDSPMLASKDLKHLNYSVAKHTFHIWINGAWQPDENKLLAAFQAFTITQIDTLGSFPCEDYHFIFQVYPYKFYHGVEHYNSTILTLGPAEDMNTPEAWENILGVSSHELFHTWNIIRIRPKEMLPYNFASENYFKTGYVAEGFTTYYGDLFLLRSHVYSEFTYFENLNKNLSRHYDNFGHQNLSLADSSFDLWLDGYSPGIPDRKVSIYTKGCLVAFMLDLMIRKHSQHSQSLDDVVRKLWKDFGQRHRGYTEEDIQTIAEKLAGIPMRDFFEKFVSGTEPIEELLDTLVGDIGCVLQEKSNPSNAARLFGFKISSKDQITTVSAIAPDSVAEKVLSKDDEIIAINGRKVTDNLEKLINGQRDISLTIFRNHQLMNVHLENRGETYFRQFYIAKKNQATEAEKLAYRAWSNYDW